MAQVSLPSISTCRWLIYCYDCNSVGSCKCALCQVQLKSVCSDSRLALFQAIVNQLARIVFLFYYCPFRRWWCFLIDDELFIQIALYIVRCSKTKKEIWEIQVLVALSFHFGQYPLKDVKTNILQILTSERLRPCCGQVMPHRANLLPGMWIWHIRQQRRPGPTRCIRRICSIR